MSDPVPSTSREDTPSDEISRSLGSVWQRHCGQRPSSVTTQIDADVVTCELEGAAAAADPNAEDDGEPAPTGISPQTRKREAIAAVSRITGRKVMGYIERRNADTSMATEKFILDGVRKRF